MLHKNEFIVRLCEMRKQYNLFVQRSPKELNQVNDTYNSYSKPHSDPFAVENCKELIGKAILYLGSLGYFLSLDESIPIVSSTGKICGNLFVQIQPYLEERYFDTVLKREVSIYENLDKLVLEGN